MRDKIAKKRAVVVTKQHLKWANIPLRYWNASAKLLSTEGKEHLMALLPSLDALVNSGTGFWIQGEYETGKTSLAVVIAKEVIRHGGVVTFIPAVRMMDYLVQNIHVEGQEETILERCERSNLVIFDDLGAESYSNSPNGQAALESLFRRFYDALISVIFTTNLTAKTYSERYPTGVQTMLKRLVKGKYFPLTIPFEAPTKSG